ncbi:MAG: hypothetical protein DCC51_12950 [Anaerolineae bacterium]|nr:MAG: hypothetical protein DCC51_12950 [Anaerolineae bacterium]
MIVLDTVALIYWTVRPERLSVVAAREIESAESLLISSISIWEIAVKSRKGHIDLTIPLREYMRGLEQIPQLQILPVDLGRTGLAPSRPGRPRDRRHGDVLRLPSHHVRPGDRRFLRRHRMVMAFVCIAGRLLAGHTR